MPWVFPREMLRSCSVIAVLVKIGQIWSNQQVRFYYRGRSPTLIINQDVDTEDLFVLRPESPIMMMKNEDSSFFRERPYSLLCILVNALPYLGKRYVHQSHCAIL